MYAGYVGINVHVKVSGIPAVSIYDLQISSMAHKLS